MRFIHAYFHGKLWALIKKDFKLNTIYEAIQKDMRDVRGKYALPFGTCTVFRSGAAGRNDIQSTLNVTKSEIIAALGDGTEQKLIATFLEVFAGYVSAVERHKGMQDAILVAAINNCFDAITDALAKSNCADENIRAAWKKALSHDKQIVNTDPVDGVVVQLGLARIEQRESGISILVEEIGPANLRDSVVSLQRVRKFGAFIPS
jgi:hypothetical protein